MNTFKLTLAALVIAAATTSAFANGQFIPQSGTATDTYQTQSSGAVSGATAAPLQTSDHDH
jgi:hypothetical protein